MNTVYVHGFSRSENRIYEVTAEGGGIGPSVDLLHTLRACPTITVRNIDTLALQDKCADTILVDPISFSVASPLTEKALTRLVATDRTP